MYVLLTVSARFGVLDRGTGLFSSFFDETFNILFLMTDLSCYMLARNKVNVMSFFGLTDPWIVCGYVGCFLCVAICIAYGFIKGNNTEEEAEEDGE